MKPIRFKDKRDAALFKRGEPMWSPDGGKTWQRGEAPASHGPAMVVTKVDKLRGSITMGVAK